MKSKNLLCLLVLCAFALFSARSVNATLYIETDKPGDTFSQGETITITASSSLGVTCANGNFILYVVDKVTSGWDGMTVYASRCGSYADAYQMAAKHYPPIVLRWSGSGTGIPAATPGTYFAVAGCASSCNSDTRYLPDNAPSSELAVLQINYGTPSQPPAQSPCTDSDSGPVSSYDHVSGFDTPGKVVENGVTHIDSCTDANWLSEWFCKGGRAMSIAHNCQYGCVTSTAGGACSPAPAAPLAVEAFVATNAHSTSWSDVVNVKTDTSVYFKFEKTSAVGTIIRQEWKLESGTLLSSERAPEKKFQNCGRYKVILTATSDNGQTATSYVIVSVDENKAPDVQISASGDVISATAYDSDTIAKYEFDASGPNGRRHYDIAKVNQYGQTNLRLTKPIAELQQEFAQRGLPFGQWEVCLSAKDGKSGSGRCKAKTNYACTQVNILNPSGTQPSTTEQVDFGMGALHFDPSEPTSGEQVKISVDLRSNSAQGTPTIYGLVDFYAQQDQRSDWTWIGSVYTQGYVAGYSGRPQITWTAPSVSSPAGEGYAVSAEINRVDASSISSLDTVLATPPNQRRVTVLGQTNTNNDYSVAGILVKWQRPNLPELSVQSIQAVGSAEKGRVDITVKNSGSESTRQGYTIKVYEGKNEQGRLLKTITDGPNFAPGTSRPYSPSFASLGLSAGTHDLFVIVDADNSIQELYEQNNGEVGRIVVKSGGTGKPKNKLLLPAAKPTGKAALDASFASPLFRMLNLLGRF